MTISFIAKIWHSRELVAPQLFLSLELFSSLEGQKQLCVAPDFHLPPDFHLLIDRIGQCFRNQAGH
jgi:hypothetical protein